MYLSCYLSKLFWLYSVCRFEVGVRVEGFAVGGERRHINSAFFIYRPQDDSVTLPRLVADSKVFAGTVKCKSVYNIVCCDCSGWRRTCSKCYREALLVAGQVRQCAESQAVWGVLEDFMVAFWCNYSQKNYPVSSTWSHCQQWERGKWLVGWPTSPQLVSIH